jgi:hypothetical protein
MIQESMEKAWKYVGRFMWSFANIEASIDNIFEIMFSLNATSFLLLHGSLDFRKKLRLVELGLKRGGKDHSETLSKVHTLADVRNAIVHSPFEAVPSFSSAEDGVELFYGDGIEFSYIDRIGKLQLPTEQVRNRKKRLQGTKLRGVPDDQLFDQSTITYSEFDEYDVQARKLLDTLVEIGGTCTPLDEDVTLRQDVAKIIASSDNVVLFKKPGLDEKTGQVDLDP